MLGSQNIGFGSNAGRGGGGGGAVTTTVYEIGEIDFNDMNDWTGSKDVDIYFQNIEAIIGINKIVVAFYAKTVDDFIQNYPYSDLFGVINMGFNGSQMGFNGALGEINDMLTVWDGSNDGGLTTSYARSTGYSGGSMYNQMINTSQKDMVVTLSMIPTNQTNSGSWVNGLMKIYCEVRDLPTFP